MPLAYNPVSDMFTTYEQVDVPKQKVELKLPLMDSPIDISSWSTGITENGTPIVRSPIEEEEDNNIERVPYPGDNIDLVQNENDATETKAKLSHTKGAETLSRIIDEVSNEKGFEELKDPTVKKLIMLQAQRESSYNPTVESKSSSAAGYFQFINGTRQKYTSFSRKDFLNDSKEQVRTAYKYLKDILNMPNAIKLKEKGYNLAQIVALGWWYPDSMRMVLNGQKNYSKGGYSIQQALKNYQ